MTRRFELTDEKSNQFWEITVAGKNVTVRYGRIGSEGQTQVKAHASPAQANAAAEKQVAEKVKRGYREVKRASGQRTKPSAPSSKRAPAKKAPAAKTSAKPARKSATKAARQSATQRGSASAQKSVTIGTQTWMVENLNVDRFRNGDRIAEAQSKADWEMAGENGEPAWCYYENLEENGTIYGKLYNWHAVNDGRGLAPDGWRIPSPEDWIEFYTNSPNKDQFAMSIVSASAWGGESEGTLNATGFSALPAGQRFFKSLVSFYGNGPYTQSGIGSFSSWWTSQATNDDEAFIFSVTNFDGFSFGKGYFFRKGYYLKSGGFSVRCIADR